MKKIKAFNFLTLNGYFQGINGDLSWHQHGNQEETEYAAKGAQSKSTLLFGRLTYQMMAGYWPTPLASQNDPDVAKGMNDSQKIVFSNTLQKAEWTNTSIMKGDIIAQLKALKQSPGNNMTILGSGSIITLLAENDMIDEYEFMIDPIALGNGTAIFKGISNKLDLELTNVKTFKSGTVLLSYKAVKTLSL